MTLKERYQTILVGFESYSFTEEQIKEEKDDFEQALKDLRACRDCTGTRCRTEINYSEADIEGKTTRFYNPRGNHYMALHRRGCRMYKRPTFALHACPGFEERGEQLRRALTAKYHQAEPTHLRGAPVD